MIVHDPDGRLHGQCEPRGAVVLLFLRQLVAAPAAAEPGGQRLLEHPDRVDVQGDISGAVNRAEAGDDPSVNERCEPGAALVGSPGASTI